MIRKLYVIVNASTGLLWSNTMGWVDQHDMDTFSEKEKSASTLPIDGTWKELCNR